MCPRSNIVSKPSILLCDGCDRGYHLGCLKPPLKIVPKGQWICDECIVSTGEDYGFEEGHDHSLESFRRRADAFKKKYLSLNPINGSQREAGESGAEEQKPGEATEAAPADGLTQVNAETRDARVPVDGNLKSEIVESDSVPNERGHEESMALEEYFEQEFWRLVESQEETVEVEYGADLHTTKTGRFVFAMDYVLIDFSQ
jgi:hypothetical protein